MYKTLTITILTICSVIAQTPVTQLTSNNVIALAGSGDTLWLATERGFNYRTSVNTQEGWPGFSIDLRDRFWGMAFGGGGVAALLYNRMGFWHFDHRTGQVRERYFRFPTELRDENDTRLLPVGGVIYANGCFWVPFGIGGMVRYDPVADNIRAIRPRDPNMTDPINMSADYGPDDNTLDSRVVLSLANYINSSGDTGILVTTPMRLFVYYPANADGGVWEELDDPSSRKIDGAPPLVQQSFNAAFTLGKKNAPPALYAMMTVKSGGGRVDTTLYSYAASSNTWFRALDTRTDIGIAATGYGAMYVISNNRVRLFADTLAAGSGHDNHLQEILTHENFRRMLEESGGEPNPLIRDILFLPGGVDGGGTLVVAAESGLYICAPADPLGGEYAPFKFINYVREVKKGESYALPGIIRASYDGRYDKSVFVYRLKRDGNVTIRVYDYNMSLVRTVVRGARRRAGERSTDPSRDFWDGTNQSGRRVSPGVYYFKITSSSGERFLGKVVLAK